jgi:CRISPR system Cascade subunit CasE
VFLTKLSIDVRSRTFRRDYGNIHDMHRTVMSAFPNLPEEQPARQIQSVLWRLDTTHGGFVQYVQSRVQPDWTKLPVGHLIRPAEVRPLKPVLEAVTAGRKLSFRLVANPTKCDGKSRKRIPLKQPDLQVDWLIRQGERCGFVLPSVPGGTPDAAPAPMPTLEGRKDSHTKITVEAVRFDGHLVVTNAEAFTEALINGIGRAKAYGCGLISLASPRSM